jgi:tetratricopeptide (TPR) repeat protein
MATLKKHQAPSLKLQRSPKPQAPNQATGHRPHLAPGAWTFFDVWFLALGAFLLGWVALASAAETAIPDLPQIKAGPASNRVHRLYVEFGERYARDHTNAPLACEFARACFDRADFATNDTQRAAIAEQGIAACRRAILLAPDSAAAHFYLGVNLGQLARTKLFTALGLLYEMEAAWKRTVELDEKFNYAGAHRCLGLLYLDAPGWPISLGSRAKARRHLEKAFQIVPDYPDNRLCLLEARLRWGEARSAQDQITALEPALQSARTNYVGEHWTRDWEDWEARWRRIKSRTGAKRPEAGEAKPAGH